MKNILLSIMILFGSQLAFSQNIQPLFLKINELKNLLIENESTITEEKLISINNLLDEAISMADQVGTMASSYTDCRQGGFSHSSCDKQPSAYLKCRQSGYSHSSCDGQFSAYLQCRQTGFSHSSCDGQPSAYLKCRQSGYSHSSCDGQNP